MITIAIDDSEILYEAPDSAIAQLEAHETITGAKAEGTLYSIPFHAIDHVTVERTPIISVTPSDDLCLGGDSTCTDAYLFAKTPKGSIQVSGRWEMPIGITSTFYCYGTTTPSEDTPAIPITLVSSSGNITAEEITDEGGKKAVSVTLDGENGGVFTIKTDSGCTITVNVVPEGGR